MLRSTALGVPRFSMTSERCSFSTRRSNLPKPVRAVRAETTMLSFLSVGCMGSVHFNYPKCTVDPQTRRDVLRRQAVPQAHPLPRFFPCPPASAQGEPLTSEA